MASIATEIVTEAYFASGLDTWLSEFGTVYYHPDVEVDSVETYEVVANGNWLPYAIVDFDGGDLVALSHMPGAEWSDAAAHLNEFWRKKGLISLEAICIRTSVGDTFVDGVLSVSPCSPLGTLVSGDTQARDVLISDPEFIDSIPLSMLYTHEVVNWGAMSAQELAEHEDKSLGMEYVGSLFAHTTGSTPTPVAVTASTSQSTFDWEAAPHRLTSSSA